MSIRLDKHVSIFFELAVRPVLYIFLLLKFFDYLNSQYTFLILRQKLVVS